MDKLSRLRQQQKMTDKSRREALDEERRLAVLEGRWIDELEQLKGWDLIMKEFIDKWLDRERFLGCRAGKLMWIQGFQAALDGLLKFTARKKAVRDQILREESRVSVGATPSM